MINLFAATSSFAPTPFGIRGADLAPLEAKSAETSLGDSRSVAPRRRGGWLRLFFGGVLASAVVCPAAERLRQEASAFLKAHGESPVDWEPWGEEAFARAKREQKPVFVAVGAFTSELSAAMRRQTFARQETAEMLNGSFVCVLVDREEHPEIAALLQAYVSKVKQGGGWPLNIWLTPELQPFEGAAYLPPSDEWGKPGFMKVAQQAKQAWTADPAGCRARAVEAVEQLRNWDGAQAPASLDSAAVRAKLAAAALAWRERLDRVNGGFDPPPKNPEPELLRFLLTQSPADREAALLTLRKIALSALHDPLDGGFFRNATDPAWNVPVLQKTLVDQARLALAYLDAAGNEGVADDTELFRLAARGALDYALTRLLRVDGTFAAAEDATGEEAARYYLWTAVEIDTLLGPESAAYKSAHGVEPAGNVSAEADVSGQFAGKNLLRHGSSSPRAVVEKLRAARDRRSFPPLDDRAPAGAHGLLLVALARAGGQLHETRYAEAAGRLFSVLEKDFLLSTAGDVRRFRGATLAAGPADYAGLALGCREFASRAKRPDAEVRAANLIRRANELFFDPRSARFRATPVTLPPGIFFRPPALSEPLAAEALMILAGAMGIPPVRPSDFPALSVWAEEEVETLSGDALLAIASIFSR